MNRRGRGRGRGGPRLRGKDIGLYYKNLNIQRKQEGGQLRHKYTTSFRIPPEVEYRLEEMIQDIQKTAIKERINLPIQEKLESLPTMKIESTNTQFNVFNESDNKDFIPLKIKSEATSTASSSYKNEDESNPYHVSNNYKIFGSQELDVKLACNSYKYDYCDIITGTFLEKLQECLSEGVQIVKTTPEIQNLSAAIKIDYEDVIATNNQYRKMLEFRKTLPTYKKRDELIANIKNHQVIVISGETGCGKSTQVPQLILDDAIKNGKGANTKILVTQPRRIAASSLAMRVAQERGEPLGTSVGYCVRLETVDCRKRGSIMFCTTGVLLVELEMNQGLGDYSHVILDEVHERDSHIDLSMYMLKEILAKRQDLKLILMSATVDAETICAYYNNCPMIHIEGLAYPVTDIYLEQILEMTNFRFSDKPERRNVSVSEPEKPWHKYTKKGRAQISNRKDMEKDINYKAQISKWLESVKHTLSKDVYKTLQDHRVEELNLDLIVDLLAVICRGEPGAILVFLPGIGDISKLIRMMGESNLFPANKYDIHALHSKLPTLTQHKIFEKPPSGVRKIIVATNIAETSITIDDIVYVVDCGKIKYSGLDVEENISTLKTEWVSKANLRQRRGRAGRCQPGVCYHLVTSHRAELLEERLLPELQRSDLLEPLLCVKKLRLGPAELAFSKMCAVPAQKTVQWAVKHLQQLGALNEEETLTPLGWHLARLPAGPAAGKVLVLGALFGCLDRAASLAAVWGFRDPFQLIIGKEREVDEAKRRLAMGEPSDHIAITEAIMQWERCGGMDSKRHFAWDHFLSHNNLILLSDMKKQLTENLRSMGFLGKSNLRDAWENRNAHNLSLFKAIVAASLYPNVATVRWMGKWNPRKPLRIKVLTPEDGKVSVHPSSVMYTKPYGSGSPVCSNPGANWLTYFMKQRSTDLYLLEVTCVHTLPLLFFGELKLSQGDNPNNCLISISSLHVSCPKGTTSLLYYLRALLDMVLASKIMRAGQPVVNSRFDEMVINAVIELITAEDAGIDSLCDDDDDTDQEDNNSRRYNYY